MIAVVIGFFIIWLILEIYQTVNFPKNNIETHLSYMKNICVVGLTIWLIITIRQLNTEPQEQYKQGQIDCIQGNIYYQEVIYLTPVWERIEE